MNNQYQNVVFDPLNQLLDIGTKLSDFQEIHKDEKPFFLLGKGNFGYAEKMISKKNNKVYAIKKQNKTKIIQILIEIALIEKPKLCLA